MRKVLLAGAVLGTLLATAAAAQAQAIVEGVWKTGNTSEVTIAVCGNQFCGTVTKPYVSPEELARFNGDAAAAAASFKDDKNKDAALRGRPVKGMQLLRIHATANLFRFEGEVYNPEDGNTYSGFLDVLDGDTLKLTGCALIVFCKDETWTRVLR